MSLPNSNGYIWADLSTNGTTGTSLLIIPDHKEVSLTVDLFSYPNHVLGAGDRA
jgi:hypothetical protein